MALLALVGNGVSDFPVTSFTILVSIPHLFKALDRAWATFILNSNSCIMSPFFLSTFPSTIKSFLSLTVRLPGVTFECPASILTL